MPTKRAVKVQITQESRKGHQATRHNPGVGII
jgi:hypothetical protein